MYTHDIITTTDQDGKERKVGHIKTDESITMRCPGTIKEDGEYTLQIIVKSTSTKTITAEASGVQSTAQTTTSWAKKILKIDIKEIKNDYIELTFQAGEYYFYHVKLEKGDRDTPWSASEEDMEDGLELVKESISEVAFLVDKNKKEIDAKVSKTEFTEYKDTEIKGIKENISQQKQSIESFETTVRETNAKFDGMQIGGSNILQDSDFPMGTKKWNLRNAIIDTETKLRGQNSVKISGSNTERLDVPVEYYGAYIPGKELTLSFYIMTIDKTKITSQISAWIEFRKIDGTANGAIQKDIKQEDLANGIWSRIEIHGKSEDMSNVFATFVLQPNNSAATIYVSMPQLEYGTKATDWSPSAADVKASMKVLETSYKQLKDRFQWIIKNGTDETSFEITDGLIRAVTDKFEIKSTNGNHTVISGGKLLTDALKSNNYTETDGVVTDGSFLDLSEGTFKSQNMTWDEYGNLTGINSKFKNTYVDGMEARQATIMNEMIAGVDAGDRFSIMQAFSEHYETNPDWMRELKIGILSGTNTGGIRFLYEPGTGIVIELLAKKMRFRTLNDSLVDFWIGDDLAGENAEDAISKLIENNARKSTNDLLWGKSFARMDSTQTAKLSAAISQQKTGICLCFSRLNSDGTPADDSFSFEVIPKRFITNFTSGMDGYQVDIKLGNSTTTVTKVLKIYDTKITGYDVNKENGAGNYVLRAVYGI